MLARTSQPAHLYRISCRFQRVLFVRYYYYYRLSTAIRVPVRFALTVQNDYNGVHSSHRFRKTVLRECRRLQDKKNRYNVDI